MKFLIEIRNNKKGIFLINELIDRLRFDLPIKDKLKVILTEIIENISHHSNTDKTTISIREYKSKKVSILILFKSNDFEIVTQKIQDPKVYFNYSEKRYRELGVIMYHNLSSLVMYKFSNGLVRILVLL
ncbi:MAG: hypothetical protein N2712_01360 [Brevinematales bacterium]|nr:hypothetical protein [Brevinematales bacterium]